MTVQNCLYIDAACDQFTADLRCVDCPTLKEAGQPASIRSTSKKILKHFYKWNGGTWGWQDSIPGDYERARDAHDQEIMDLIQQEIAVLYIAQSVQTSPRYYEPAAAEPVKGKNYEQGLWSMRNYEAMLEDGNRAQPVDPAKAAIKETS